MTRRLERARVGRVAWGPRMARGLRAPRASGGGRLAGLVLALALTSAGCGMFGGGKSAPVPTPTGAVPTGEHKKLRLVAQADLNNCGDGPSNALGVRVYQLVGDAAISGIPQVALWENDEPELGEELVDRQEFFLDPQQTLELELDLMANARFVAVVGNYCRTEGDCWRWIQPIDKLGGETTLTFGPTCMGPAR